MRVWSVAEKTLQSDLGVDGGSIRWVRFLDDSRLLLIPSFTSTAIVVTLDPTGLAEAGSVKVTRSFTGAEWMMFRAADSLTTKSSRTAAQGGN